MQRNFRFLLLTTFEPRSSRVLSKVHALFKNFQPTTYPKFNETVVEAPLFLHNYQLVDPTSRKKLKSFGPILKKLFRFKGCPNTFVSYCICLSGWIDRPTRPTIDFLPLSALSLVFSERSVFLSRPRPCTEAPVLYSIIYFRTISITFQ